MEQIDETIFECDITFVEANYLLCNDHAWSSIVSRVFDLVQVMTDGGPGRADKCVGLPN